MVNPLSKQMVFEAPLPSEMGKFVAVACDPHTSINYLLSGSAVIKAEIAGTMQHMCVEYSKNTICCR